MKKNYSSLIIVVLIAGILAFLFATLTPSWSADEEEKVTEFSTSRALEHVTAIDQRTALCGYQKPRSCGKLYF